MIGPPDLQGIELERLGPVVRFVGRNSARKARVLPYAGLSIGAVMSAGAMHPPRRLRCILRAPVAAF